MPLNTNLAVTVSVEGSVSAPGDFGQIQQNLLARTLLNFVTGTATGQADLVFSDTRTLASNANESLDLNGVLLDVFGNAANFVKVAAIFIRADKANINNLIVGGAAANGFIPMFGSATDTLKLPPGAGVMLFNDGGWTVTPATADLLKIANGAAGSTVNYDVLIIGRSA